MSGAEAESPTQMVARLDGYWPYGKNTVAMELARELESLRAKLQAAERERDALRDGFRRIMKAVERTAPPMMATAIFVAAKSYADQEAAALDAQLPKEAK